jgi:hypothetical protein
MRLTDEDLEIAARSVLRMDVVVIGDVVAIVPARGWIEGQQPDGVDTEILDVFELAGEAAEIANPVVIAVEERPDVDLVDDRILVPERIARAPREIERYTRHE